MKAKYAREKQSSTNLTFSYNKTSKIGHFKRINVLLHNFHLTK